MLKKTIPTTFIIIVLAIMQGCATLSDAKSAKGAGSAKIYNASQETVWQAILPILHGAGLDVVSQNKQEGHILAQRGLSMFSYGEHVAIFVETIAKDQTRVEVVSKKALVTNLFATNWEIYIQEQLSEKFKS